MSESQRSFTSIKSDDFACRVRRKNRKQETGNRKPETRNGQRRVKRVVGGFISRCRFTVVHFLFPVLTSQFSSRHSPTIAKTHPRGSLRAASCGALALSRSARQAGSLACRARRSTLP